MPHRVSPATTVWVTAAGCASRPVPGVGRERHVGVRARRQATGATGRAGWDVTRSWPRTTTAVIEGGDGSSWVPSRGAGCLGDRGAGRPRWWRHRVRSRPRPASRGWRRDAARTSPGSGCAAPRRSGTGRDVVREGPADGDGQDGGDADQSGDQHGERAEPFYDLADRGPRRGLGGRGHGHPPVVMPLTSVADSVTVIWRLADADDAEELGGQAVADLGVDGVALAPRRYRAGRRRPCSSRPW